MSADETIYTTALGDGIPETLALLIVAQARHETGNYRHRFFTIGNNAFGYSYKAGAKWQLPNPGPTADNGEAIAQYSSVEDSVHEITSWIGRRQRDGIFPANLSSINTPEEYAKLLKAGRGWDYYTASIASYTDGLKRGLEQIGKTLTTPGSVGIAALVLLLLFAFRHKLFPR